MKNIKKKFIPLTLLLIGSMILSVIPINDISLASPGIVTIRQEINILDSVLSANANTDPRTNFKISTRISTASRTNAYTPGRKRRAQLAKRRQCRHQDYK